jgi:hypothetical protein
MQWSFIRNENATIAFMCVLISCDIPVKIVGQLIILLFNEFIASLLFLIFKLEFSATPESFDCNSNI